MSTNIKRFNVLNEDEIPTEEVEKFPACMCMCVYVHPL